MYCSTHVSRNSVCTSPIESQGLRLPRRFAAALLTRLFGNNVPCHTTRAPLVVLEPGTNDVPFYAIANLDKTFLTMLWSCKFRFAQDLLHCFQAYRRVLPRFSMSLFTQLAHLISSSFYNSPQFYEMLPQEEIGITRTAKKKKKEKRKKKYCTEGSAQACSTGGACAILQVLPVFESSSVSWGGVMKFSVVAWHRFQLLSDKGARRLPGHGLPLRLNLASVK